MQQSSNTANNIIPSNPEKHDSIHNIIPNTNPQPTVTGSSRSRERVKNRADGHIVSEPTQDGSDKTDSHPNIADVGVGVALVGSAVAISGVIAGSTAVTAIGVTTAVIGGTCCLLEGK
jgi:hypothetical protein